MNPITSTYIEWLHRSRNTRNYFTFFRPYQKIMKRLDALFLQDLWNLSSLPNIKTQVIDGKTYFLCMSNFLQNSDSEWTIEEQKPRFASLLKRGYITIKRMGIPPCRWVTIEIEKIERDLDERLQLVANDTDQEVANDTICKVSCGTVHYNVKNKEEEEQTNSYEASEARRGSANGFIGLNGKRKSFSEQAKDWTLRLKARYERESKLIMQDNDFICIASFLTGFTKKQDSKKIESFVRAVELGQVNYLIGTAGHLERCYDQWIEMNSKITWKKLDGDGSVIIRQNRSPTMEELEEGIWTAFRAGAALSEDEENQLRSEIFKRSK